MKNIIFFDEQCGMCRRTINFIGRHDHKKKFVYAALEGKTAEKLLIGRLSHFRDLNTVVVIEQPSGKIWLRGRAVFRVLWILGGWWKFVGWMYEMPFVDAVYKVIAKHRRRGGDLPVLKVHLLP